MFMLAEYSVLLVLLVAMPAVAHGHRHGSLTLGFYDKTCPQAEVLVQQAVADGFANNPGIAAGLIRLHFHDCFVRGCDASILLDQVLPNGYRTEKQAPANYPSSRGFEVIDTAKANIDSQCPGIVSCADILAFAARDSSALAGNITYDVPAGRRDGLVSREEEVVPNFPSPNFNLTENIKRFAVKKLSLEDMVILSSAHSIGVAHCATFTNRLYNLTTPDPTLSSSYADLLRNACPSTSTLETNLTVKFDIISPDVLDNKYYVGVQLGLGLVSSDQMLMNSPASRAMVKSNADNPKAWAKRFAAAMVKMGSIVEEGKANEIRKNCRVINRRQRPGGN